MGNLLGQSFFPYVTNQVKARQKVYGKSSRTPDEIRYMNANSAWVRIASTVKLTKERVDLSGFPDLYQVDYLAKNYVLFGGTSNFYSNSTSTGTSDADGRGGELITSTQFNSFYSGIDGYRLGGDSQGFRPQPGITSFDTKNKNRGSIRETNITIKCYNTEQFNIIDTLYLRLGYGIFVEWGHSLYVDNNGNIQEMEDSDTLASKFLNGDFDAAGPIALNQAIEGQRKALNGNYDGFFGTVKNFSWNFETDGSYTINVSIISGGDIIESLKVNSIPNTIKKQTAEEQQAQAEAEQNAEEEEDYLAAVQEKNQLAKVFWTVRNNLNEAANSDINWGTVFLVSAAVVVGGVITVASFGAGAPIAGALIGGAITYGTAAALTVGAATVAYAGSQIYYGKFTSDENITFGSYSLASSLGFQIPDLPDEQQTNGDFIKITEANGTFESDDNLYYTRFGSLLYYINNNMLLYTGGNSSKQPLLVIDNDPSTNIIFTTENVLSSDPRVCVVKADIATSQETYNIFSPLPDFKKEIEGQTIGYLMNIYLNNVFLLKAIEEVKDEDGNANLFDWLNKICEGINNSLGRLNKLSPVIDEPDTRIYFVDETTIPNREKIYSVLTEGNKDYQDKSQEKAKFEVFGYTEDNASFITNLGIRTEISNQMASMLTIGAQKKGLAVGMDATAFSKWNEGLEDRITPNKIDYVSSQDATDTEISNNYESTEKEFNNFCNQMSTYDWDKGMDSFPDILSNYLNALQAQHSIQSGSASTTGIGFLPINLNIEMIGLSGPRIYDAFTINSSFLPPNYENTLEFLVKGISHKIQGNKWITSIESLSVPSSNVASTANNRKTTYHTPSTSPTNNTSGTSSPGPASADANSASNAGLTAGAAGSGCLPNTIYNGVPALVSVPDDQVQIRIDSLQAAVNATFANGEPQNSNKYLCARYTYNHAYNFVQSLKNKSLTKGATIAAGGNADSAIYRANLINLGYTQHVVYESGTKAQLKNVLENQNNFNPGDVAIYYSLDKDDTKHFHTQIFVTNSLIKYNNKTSPLGWTTDRFNNFGTAFAYNSRKANCWVLIIMRAPIDGSDQSTKESRKLYEDYIKNLRKITLAKDNFGTNSDNKKIALLSPYISSYGDDEKKATDAIRAIFGLKSKGYLSTTEFNKISAQFDVNKLQKDHKTLFIKYLAEVLNQIDDTASGDVRFYLPDEKDPKKVSKIYYLIWTDIGDNPDDDEIIEKYTNAYNK